MTEKRKHQRFVKRCEVEFISNDTTCRGIASNFSLNGLFIRTNKPLSPNTIIDLLVHLPNNSTSQLRGIVKWALRTTINMFKNGMGIELIEKDSNYSDFITSSFPHISIEFGKRKEQTERENTLLIP